MRKTGLYYTDSSLKASIAKNAEIESDQNTLNCAERVGLKKKVKVDLRA